MKPLGNLRHRGRRPWFSWTTQCCRRALAEQLAERNRKPPQLPKPMLGRDLSDSPRCGVGQGKCTSRQRHAPQKQISMRPHAKVVQAMEAKCASWNADGRADLREIERNAGVGFDHLLEAPHYLHP